MVCPRCGAVTVAGAAFCGNCGAPVMVAAAPAAALGGTAAVVASGGTAATVAAPAPSGAVGVPFRHVAGAGDHGLHYFALGGLGCLGMVLGFFLLTVLITTAHSFGVFLVSVGLAVLMVPIYASVIIALDRHDHKPAWLLGGAFLWGAVIATGFALLGNDLNGSLFKAIFGPNWASLLTASLSAPFVEETSKGLALLLIFLFVRSEFNDVVDGIVLGALVGLGFAMTENVLYIERAYVQHGLLAASLLWFVRVILGGFGHALYTGATGAGLGLAEETDNPRVRVLAPILGWFCAMLLHFLWNTTQGFVGAVLQPSAAVALFVLLPFETLVLTLPGVATLVAIGIFAWRRETRVVTEQLRDEVQNGVITPGEYAVLANDRERTRRVWHALFSHGPAAWYILRHFYNEATALAFRKWHTGRGERLPDYQRGLSEEAHRAHIAATRLRLQHAGVPTE
jgi:RsiW-degrading membrane proteinase PrsW (M82 family)